MSLISEPWGMDGQNQHVGTQHLFLNRLVCSSVFSLKRGATLT